MAFKTFITGVVLLIVQELLCAQPGPEPRAADHQNRTLISNQRPSLLPQPKALAWKTGVFRVGPKTTILAAQKGLEHETRVLQEWMREKGYPAVAVVSSVPPGRNAVSLCLVV